MASGDCYLKAYLSWTSETGAGFTRLLPQLGRLYVPPHDLSMQRGWLPHKMAVSRKLDSTYGGLFPLRVFKVTRSEAARLPVTQLQKPSCAFYVFYTRSDCGKGLQKVGNVVHWEDFFKRLAILICSGCLLLLS